MRHIRIYLLLRDPNQLWRTQIYRDIDEAISHWIEFRCTAGGVGLLHVGIYRPTDTDLMMIDREAADCLLLTASARWAFADLGTYSSRAGFVGNLGIYIALSGWGYDLTKTPKIFEENNSNDVSALMPHWLKSFKDQYPTLSHEIEKCGIDDDLTYINFEHALPWNTRRKLGIVRTEILISKIDNENPILIVNKCPPWILNAPLSSIRLTVRCGNSLRLGGVVMVNELLSMSPAGLLELPNFGRKSLRDLSASLLAAVQDGPAGMNKYDTPSSVILEVRDLNSEVITSRHSERDNGIMNFCNSFSFRKSKLRDSDAEVLNMRLGIDQSSMTLAEIGDKLGITRERVRQIEARAIAEFTTDPVWTMQFAPKLSRILDNREDPLPVKSLDLFEIWFEGIANMCVEFQFVVERLLPKQFHLLDINGCKIITEISNNSWEVAVGHARNILSQSVTKATAKSELRIAVAGLLADKGKELVGELWAAACREAVFVVGEGGVERLMGMGTSAETYVLAALSSSAHPLHYSELPRRVYDLFGRPLEIRRAHNAASNVGLLYGRGTFGTIRHCPLTNSELIVLREEAEAVVLSGPAGRQWTSLEILSQIDGQTIEFLERVNQFVVQIALRESTRLSDLGRFIWQASSNNGGGTANRIDLTQAVLSVLQSAGGPLTREEIRDRLLEHRGLSGYFQLHPRGSLAKVSADRWGILERDIPFSAQEREIICNSAEEVFVCRQSGIHFSELNSLRSGLFTFSEPCKEEDPHLLQAVLLADPRFKASGTGYLYLARWEGPRRLSQSDAVIQVLREANGLGLHSNEIARRASTILGRTMERECIYAAIATVGGKFDEASSTWKIVEDANDELEIPIPDN